MPTVVATAGATNANSYATVAEGTTYFDERLQTDNWTDADNQARALIMATRRIDTLRFEGEKAASGQALKWPRISVFDDNGDEYASDSIPTLVKHATFEEALRILNDNASSKDTFAVTGLAQFKRAKVGPLEVEIDETFRPGDLTDTALRILRPVLLRSAGLLAELVRA